MKKLLLSFCVLLLSLSSFGQWTKNYLVDEFGDKTNIEFVGQKCIGTFSNSATIGSKMTAEIKVVIEKSQTIIRVDLLEYGRIFPAYHEGEVAILMIRKSNGDRYRYRLINYGNHLEYNVSVYEDNNNKVDSKDLLLNILKTETNPIMFHISREEGSSYDFTVNPKGFSTVFK